jgi:hypothetical protein
MTNEDLEQIRAIVSGAIGSLEAKVDARFDKVDARFDTVDSRFDMVDARLDSVEAAQAATDAKLDRLTSKVDGMEVKLDRVIARADDILTGVVRLRTDAKNRDAGRTSTACASASRSWKARESDDSPQGRDDPQRPQARISP